MVGGPRQRSKNGRKTYTQVKKWSEDPYTVRKHSRDLPEGPELVGGRSQRSGSGRVTLYDVRKWLRDTPGGTEVVGGPSRRFGNGRGTLP